MAFKFQKATKTQSRLHMALIGPSGSGKTYTALAIATHLKKPVAVIDTERGSASKYADLFEFDVLELESFSPETYVGAIEAACAADYGTIIIDSLSHAWMGKDGALEQVDRTTKRGGGNSFTAWREVTPMHNRLVDSILQSSAHIIVTMRTKTEYVIEEDARGKKVPRKIGLAPVQRDGLDYEFDVVGDMNLDNELVIGKTRCSAVAKQVYPRPGKDVAAILNAWLTDGAPAVEKPKTPSTPPPGPSPLTGKLDAALAIEAEDERAIAFNAIIEEAPDMPGLLAVGAGIAKAKFSEDIKKAVGEAWAKRRATLNGKAA